MVSLFLGYEILYIAELGSLSKINIIHVIRILKMEGKPPFLLSFLIFYACGTYSVSVYETTKSMSSFDGVLQNSRIRSATVFPSVYSSSA